MRLEYRRWKKAHARDHRGLGELRAGLNLRVGRFTNVGSLDFPRWHSSCLICGGKEAKKLRKDADRPGCAKQLDSAAKVRFKESVRKD